MLVIRQMIQEGKIQETFPLIELISPSLLEESPKISLMLHAQQYIEYIRSGETLKAIEYAQNHLNKFDKETIYSLNAKGIPVQTSIEVTSHFLRSCLNSFSNIGLDRSNLLYRPRKQRTWTFSQE